MNVISDRDQPLVVDSLPVMARHIIGKMSHDSINSDLITAAARNGFERVTQSVEAETFALQFQILQQLVKCVSDLVEIACPAGAETHPAVPVLRDKAETIIC